MYSGTNLPQRVTEKGRRIGVALAWLLVALVWPILVNAAADPPLEDDAPILNDAMIPPDVALMTRTFLAPSDQTGLASPTTASPGYYETSDFMIGHVAVGLILPESDGYQEAQSEDWTDEEVEQVQAQVQDALAWWASLEPAAHLTFTVETHLRVPTGFEPITHGLADERLWVGEVLAVLGFEADGYFNAVRDYVNDLRNRVESDWAFAIFVADSSADYDGRFADAYFAYAYIGGPFVVMTYDNSMYGINNMAAVAAHEIGHVFRALDQYAAAGVPCDFRAGYLDVRNDNSLVGGGCERDEPSIMRSGTSPYYDRAIDHFARGQLGWWDSDGDGVLDPVDAEPEVAVRLAGIEGANSDILNLAGDAWQEPVASPSLADVAINRISAVGAYVDETSWITAMPEDGQFDAVSERFHLQVGPLAPGLHTLEIQAVNSEGLVSRSSVTTTFIYDPVDGALNSALSSGPELVLGYRMVRFEGLATAAYGDSSIDAPTVAAVQYQVDDDGWRDAIPDDGRFDSAIEGFGMVLSNLPEGLHSLTVRTVDSNGRIESNVEARQFEIPPAFWAFLPMVQR